MVATYFSYNWGLDRLNGSKCWLSNNLFLPQDSEMEIKLIESRMLYQLRVLQVNRERLRENLERIVGTDDSTFSGIDLATLIRNKYGRSYDIQLIKKVCIA